MKQLTLCLLFACLIALLTVSSAAAIGEPLQTPPPVTGVPLPLAPGQYNPPSETCGQCQARVDRDTWLYSAPNFQGVVHPVVIIPAGTVLTVRAATNDFWFVSAGAWTGFFIDRSQTTRL